MIATQFKSAVKMAALVVSPLLVWIFVALLLVTTVSAASVGAVSHVSTSRRKNSWGCIDPLASRSNRRSIAGVGHYPCTNGIRRVATATTHASRRRGGLSANNRGFFAKRQTIPHFQRDEARFASSTTTVRKNKGATTNEELPYGDLNILAKVVGGVVEIGTTIVFEYLMGFVSGYGFGTVVGIPGLVARPLDSAARTTFWKEVSGRTLRMHGRSARWALSYGSLSASFGGFRAVVSVLRNGKDDEWSSVLSCMAAGAFFSRAEGPQGMLRGAIMYGGLTYLLSGGLDRKKSTSPFDYEEQAIDF